MKTGGQCARAGALIILYNYIYFETQIGQLVCYGWLLSLISSDDNYYIVCERPHSGSEVNQREECCCRVQVFLLQRRRLVKCV